jgi:anaerobic selenocysteine-containing dehydrogenase
MQPAHDDGSRLLAEALRAATLQRTDDRVRSAIMPTLMRYHDGLTRLVIGDEKADHLGTPHRDWVQVVRRMSRVIGAIESMRQRLPLATAVAERLGNRAWTQGVERELNHKPARFEPPRDTPFAHRFARKAA